MTPLQEEGHKRPLYLLACPIFQPQNTIKFIDNEFRHYSVLFKDVKNTFMCVNWFVKIQFVFHLDSHGEPITFLQCSNPKSWQRQRISEPVLQIQLLLCNQTNLNDLYKDTVTSLNLPPCLICQFWTDFRSFNLFCREMRLKVGL